MEAWADVTRGPFALHVFSGTHFFIRAGAPAAAALMTDYVQRLLPPHGALGASAVRAHAIVGGSGVDSR
jgi:hypothetical protein